MSCVLGCRVDYEVVHQKLQVEVDFARKSLRGVCTLWLLPHQLPSEARDLLQFPSDPAAAPAEPRPGPPVDPDALATGEFTPASMGSTPALELGDRGFKPLDGPTEHDRIFLNCSPQIQLHSVQLEGNAAKYHLFYPGEETGEDIESFDLGLGAAPSYEKVKGLRSLGSFDAVMNARLDWFNKGELMIEVPKDLAIGQRLANVMDVNELQQINPKQRSALAHLVKPLRLTIAYEIIDPTSGLQFVLPNDAFPRRSHHMFSTTSQGDCATWFPCRDSHWERCTFEMEVTVPATYLVASSGRLVEQVFANDTQTLKTYKFSVDEPILAKALSLVVGEFDMMPDTECEASCGIAVTHFMAPGFGTRDDLFHSVACLNEIFNEYSDYLGGKFPFSSYQQVFVDLSVEPYASHCNTSIFSANLIHGEIIIDRTFELRRLMAEAVARSWITHCVFPKSVADQWIVEGLIGLLVSRFIGANMGRNEQRYYQKESIETAAKLSSHPIALPISSEKYGHPSEINTKAFRLKSTCVIHMMAEKVGSNVFRDIVRLLMYSSDEPYVSTKKLLKMCRHRTGYPFDDIRDLWIYGGTCPVLQATVKFNRKKTCCTVHIEQLASSQVNGRIQVRIHETDMQTYEYDLRMDSLKENANFMCHTKVRKNRKRTENDEEQIEQAELQEQKEMNPLLRRDKGPKNDTPIRWVQIDPKFEWIRLLTVYQQPLWCSLALRESSEVVAQLEAVQGLGWHLSTNATGNTKDPVPVIALTSQSLHGCLANKDYYYRVRMAVAHQLARSASGKESARTEGTRIAQLNFLFDYFKSRYYDENRTLIQPNDFSDFSDYFVQRAVLRAMANISSQAKQTPSLVVEFLLDVLKYNDNSQNYYSDCFYLADLIKALADMRPSTAKEAADIKQQIIRCLDSDKLFPSYRWIVSQASLEALAQICVREQNSMVDSLEASNPPLNENESQLVPDEGAAKVVEKPNSDKPGVSPSVLSTVNLIQGYLSSTWITAVRVQAASSLAFIGARYPSALFILIEAINAERYPQVRLSLAHAWSLVFANRSLRKQLENLTSSSATNQRLMDALWEMLISKTAQLDNRFRFCIYKIYLCIYGRNTPRCAPAGQLQRDSNFIVQSSSGMPNARRRMRTKDTGGKQTKKKKRKKNVPSIPPVISEQPEAIPELKPVIVSLPIPSA